MNNSKISLARVALTALLMGLLADQVSAQRTTLRVVTLNAWHGLRGEPHSSSPHAQATTMDRKRVFIHSEDAELALHLVRLLDRHGVTAFWGDSGGSGETRAAVAVGRLHHSRACGRLAGRAAWLVVLILMRPVLPVRVRTRSRLPVGDDPVRREMELESAV